MKKSVLDLKHLVYYNTKALNEWADFDHADLWIVAAAIATGGTIVIFETTNRIARGSAKVGKVKIGDVAGHFGIKYENIYGFMREKNIQL